MKFRRKFYYKILNGEKVFCLELDKETLKNMVLDLQQRIDKAVEYITHEHFKREQLGITNLSFSENELNILLDILKGEE